MLLISAAHWGSVEPFNPTAGSNLLDVPLMYQLWPNVAAGTATPTFSCAGAGGTVQDWEGVLRKCKPNEARFPGARRVENMIRGSSQNLTVSPWTTYNVGTLSAAPVRTWAYAGTQATRLQLNRGTDTAAGVCSVYQDLLIPVAVTGAYRLQVTMQSLAGAANIVIALGNQIYNLTVGAAWVTWSFMPVSSWNAGAGVPPSFAIAIYGTNSGGVNNNQQADLLVADTQVENVSGQSNTNPGEYVSVGMGLATYAYSNVDGVQCFGTKLANTIAGNVVTRVAGSIPLTTTNGASAAVCDTVGPLGILMDSQATVAYIIEWDFTVAAPGNMSYSNKNVGGPTADYYACAIIENTVNGAHYINPYGTLPFATTNSFCGFFVKPNVRNNILINFGIGPDIGQIVYTLTGNGVANNPYGTGLAVGTGTFRGCGIIPHKDGWYYCWVAMSGVAASTSMNVVLYGQSGAAYAGSGTTAWWLYGLVVMDTGSDIYSYPVQHAIATRGTDTLTFPGNNMHPNFGTAYAEIKVKWKTAFTYRPILTGDNSTHWMLAAWSGWPSNYIFMHDAVNLAYRDVYDANVGSFKVASAWHSGYARIMCTGSGQPVGAGTSAAPFSGTMAGSVINVGWGAWNGIAMGGQIRNVRIWNYVASPNELKALTA